MIEKKSFVKKNWGWENWFDNNELYCGKLICVEHGKWSSEGNYHYHKKKTETFFVIEGALRIDYVNRKGTFKSIWLDLNESFRIGRYIKHRFTAVSDTECKFIEVSTTHDDNDSYRVKWDEESENWIPVK